LALRRSTTNPGASASFSMAAAAFATSSGVAAPWRVKRKYPNPSGFVFPTTAYSPHSGHFGELVADHLAVAVVSPRPAVRADLLAVGRLNPDVPVPEVREHLLEHRGEFRGGLRLTAFGRYSSRSFASPRPA